MRIGFIGTGTITCSVVHGLLTGDDPPERIVVSPRNSRRAASLGARFPQVRVAADNQQVADECDVLCIALRPQIARAVLGELRFRADLTVVSLVATLPMDELSGLASPAGRIFRLGPLPSAERRLGPVLLYPPDATMQALFGRIGTPVLVRRETELDALWAVTAMMAPYFGLLDTLTTWLRQRDVPADRADAYVAALFHALADSALGGRGEGFATLTAGHATRGGLNEQLLREFRARDWFGLPARGLSLILRRLRGDASLEDGLSANHGDA